MFNSSTVAGSPIISTGCKYKPVADWEATLKLFMAGKRAG